MQSQLFNQKKIELGIFFPFLKKYLDLPKQTHINEVTKFALTAIESFTDKHLTQCGNLTDIPCRFQSMVDNIDTNYPYERYFRSFCANINTD